MAFVKKTWKDRIVQYANRRLLTKSGGEVEQVTVTRDEGTISEAGDQFNASNMNDLENRVNDGFSGLNGANIPIESGSATDTKSYIDTGLSGKLDVSAIKTLEGTGTTDASGIVTATGLGVSQLDYGHHLIIGVQSSNNSCVVNVGQYNSNFYFVCSSAYGLQNPIANTSVTLRIAYISLDDLA